MNNHSGEHQTTRRQFLRQSACAALGYTGLVNTLAHLTLVNSALGQSSLGGYRALVVVFLYGGNDSNNMLIPRMGHPAYEAYKSGRGVLGIYDPNDPASPPSAMRTIPIATPDGNYGLHPNLQPLQTMFNEGDLAFVANVGSLAYPLLTQEDYINGSVPPPDNLFAHTCQQVQWQSSISDQISFTTGWGGRVADVLHGAASASNAISMSISLDGINSFQVGNEVNQYVMNSSGAISLSGYGTNYAGAWNGSTYTDTTAGKRLKTFEDIMRFTRGHLLESGYNDVVKSARANEELVGSAIAAAAATGVNFDAFFGSGTDSEGLSGQLKMVAKLIAGRSALGNSRQIFFCSARGFDTHAAQKGDHDTLMQELGAALKAFRDSMKALNVNDQVLTLSSSDFSRTLSPNKPDPLDAGTDHAWGGHQIVMGGAVNGGRIYGHFPNLLLNTGRDVNPIRGRGRWIPTTSVEQYVAAAARWLGVDQSSLASIFPNLHRFDDPFSAPANLAYLTL